MTLSTLVQWIQAVSRAMARPLPLALLPVTWVFAQSMTPVATLSFGAFVAGSGSVSVSAEGGRVKSGAVVLVAQGASPSAARFAVNGTPNTSFSISLPANGEVVLADAGSHTMAVNDFVSSPAGSGVLLGNGSSQVAVGATLVVGTGQATGSYSGSFGVTLNYE
jgi:hypothetical protein